MILAIDLIVIIGSVAGAVFDNKNDFGVSTIIRQVSLALIVCLTLVYQIIKIK